LILASPGIPFPSRKDESWAENIYREETAKTLYAVATAVNYLLSSVSYLERLSQIFAEFSGVPGAHARLLTFVEDLVEGRIESACPV
jgi:hypothetical protein